MNARKLPTLRMMERDLIVSRLNQLNGNRTHTAKSLGIGIRTLQRKLKSYGLSWPVSRPMATNQPEVNSSTNQGAI